MAAATGATAAVAQRGTSAWPEHEYMERRIVLRAATVPPDPYAGLRAAAACHQRPASAGSSADEMPNQPLRPPAPSLPPPTSLAGRVVVEELFVHQAPHVLNALRVETTMWCQSTIGDEVAHRRTHSRPHSARFGTRGTQEGVCRPPAWARGPKRDPSAENRGTATNRGVTGRFGTAGAPDGRY